MRPARLLATALCASGLTLLAPAQPAARNAHAPAELAPTRERQAGLIDQVLAMHRAGELSLDNGHMWIDGHVYPYAFFSRAEVRAIEAFGRMRHRVLHEVETVRYHPAWRDGMQAPDFDDRAWETVPVGRGTGRQFSEEAYRFTLPPLPAAGEGRERFFALRPLHPSKEAWPETTIYVNGHAAGALVRWHDFWELTSLMEPDRENQITLKAFGIYNDPPRGYRQIAVVERDPVFDRLYWNVRVLCEAASIIPESAPVHAAIRALIRDVLTTVDLVQLETPFGRAQAAAADERLEAGRLALREHIHPAASPAADFTVGLLYHAHHDTAWQWTVAHSRGKTERAVLNNLYLMDRYPDYRYLYTAPYHYETLREDRPDLFARVRELVQAGRWEANGAMWIEADVRLPSGESLIRQMLYGMEYFENQLGVPPEDHVLFLPDTFGHSPVMPQLMRGFGLDTLFAMRVRDVQNPHDVFRWQGIDGTQVLVNAITTPAWEYPYLPELHGGRGGGNDVVSYSAPDPGPRRTFGVWESFRQKGATDRQVMTIGWGDGGGGGTEDHVEVARRVAELPWLPRLEVTSAADLARAQHTKWDALPVYADDLYVGFQRTFTRANRIKQEDRAAARLLHDAEFLGTWARRFGTTYDAATVKQGWRAMLVNQMHDIITGQSVPEVNDEAIALYDPFRAAVTPVRDRGLAALAGAIGTSAESLLLINPTGFARGGITAVDLPAGRTLLDATGRALPVQPGADGRAWVHLTEPLPPYGYEALPLTAAPAAGAEPTASTGLRITERILENAHLRITLDADGQIASFFDKAAQRELVPPGRVHNQLLAARVSGGFGPAATAPTAATPITALTAIRVAERGPLVAAWEIERRHGESTLRQRLVLTADARELLFENDIDWREATELHVDFPLAVHTTEALQGIQFGHQRQSTTRNNPADAARSLLAVHDWIALAEDDFGVALLNDGRMGHDVKHGGIRLVLFTNQQVANANGDRGANRFTYALRPYQGRLVEGEVVPAARALNHPLITTRLPAQAGPMPARASLAAVEDAPSVELSAIKPAEDGDGWIVRLYESGGRHTTATLALAAPVTSVTAVDLRERGDEGLPLEGGRTRLTFTPFQIRTVRVR